MLTVQDFATLSNNNLVEYLELVGVFPVPLKKSSLSANVYSRYGNDNYGTTYSINQLIMKKKEGKKLISRPAVPLKSLIIETFLKIRSQNVIADLFRTMLPYMATYITAIYPQQFGDQNTISYESDNNVEEFFRGSCTCWDIKLAIAELVKIKMSQLDLSGIKFSYEMNNKRNVDYLIKITNENNNIIILFSGLEMVGTSEGHDFVFLKDNGITYWFPIGPSEKVLNKLGLHPMTTVVEVDKSIESVFSSLEELINNRDINKGVELVNKYFPGLSLSSYPSKSGHFTVEAFFHNPINPEDFSNFWDMIIKSLDNNRNDLIEEAKIIQRDIDYCITLIG